MFKGAVGLDVAGIEIVSICTTKYKESISGLLDMIYPHYSNKCKKAYDGLIPIT